MKTDTIYERSGYYVRTRYGWGWEVRGPNGFQSAPVSSQQEAIDLVDALASKVELQHPRQEEV